MKHYILRPLLAFLLFAVLNFGSCEEDEPPLDLLGNAWAELNSLKIIQDQGLYFNLDSELYGMACENGIYNQLDKIGIVSGLSDTSFLLQFEANIEIFKQNSITITTKYCPVIHCGNIRQTARIKMENNKQLRVGDKATVRFRFIGHPEFLEIGTKFFFREGRTKGAGIITDILPLSQDVDPNPAASRHFRRNRRNRRKKRQRKRKRPPL